MSEEAEPIDPQLRKVLRTRVAWFLAGSVVNYLLISTPFNQLSAHTQLSVTAKAAISLGISSSIFFVWNYFINFRTNSRKRDALLRYVAAVICMWSLSTLTLAQFKKFDAHLRLTIVKVKIDLDVVATQAMLAGLKFFLYHLWVFPPVALPAAERREKPANEE